MTVTAIFDIGKTNKKFFLFDRQFREVYRAYSRFEETTDEDGFPCENLELLTAWMKETLQEALARPEFDIRYLNFSTYGASFVHLDKEGRPVAPLYNYLKPLPEQTLQDFFALYGPADEWAARTASPVMGALNSGLQLFWLKHQKPETFSRIHRSLHFPQYCSFLFTGQQFSEYTSIGCHTGLWDFEANDYHQWAREEGLDTLLAPIMPTTTTITARIEEKTIQVGVGIHDSSAALLPYIMANKSPFLLASTGTWSITLNPFSTETLNVEDLHRDCLHFMRADGRPVRAARLFLGNEYKIWAQRLAAYFHKPYEAHRHVKPDVAILKGLERLQEPVFRWESIRRPGHEKDAAGETNLSLFSSYEEAFHQLARELVLLQTEAIYLAKGKTQAKKAYIDGGFVDNELFIQLLARSLKDIELISTESPLGSALGAAMAANRQAVGEDFLQENFSPQKQKAIHP